MDAFLKDSGQSIGHTMIYKLNFILLFWIPIIKLTIGLIDVQSIYEDLQEKDTFCSLDTCSDRFNDSVLSHACGCDADCVRFDNCCLDSPYIQAAGPKLKSACRWPKGQMSCFMVDRCPTNDNPLERLCSEEIYGQEDDILRIVPVTSLLTSVTYKNFFCFRCHEANDEFIYWKVKLFGIVLTNYYESMSSDELQSDYDKHRYSLTTKDGNWIASFRNGSASLPLWLQVEVPQEIKPFVKACFPYIISTCSAEWTDSEVLEKCQAYTRVREVIGNNYLRRYKNMHCALCNFEDLNNITCKTRDGYGGVDHKIYFSFTHLLDINKAGGDRVGMTQRCDADHIWDSYAKRCRRLTCAVPGYKIRNGKCEPH